MHGGKDGSTRVYISDSSSSVRNSSIVQTHLSTVRATRQNQIRQKGALFLYRFRVRRDATPSSLGRAEASHPRTRAETETEGGFSELDDRRQEAISSSSGRAFEPRPATFEARRIRRRVRHGTVRFLAARVTREDVGHLERLGGRFRLPENRAGPPGDRVHLTGVRLLFELRSGDVSRRREARGVVVFAAARDSRRPTRERERARGVAGPVAPSRRRARDARRVRR